MAMSFNGGSLKRSGANISWSWNGTLIVGINTITVRATDVSGNMADILIMVIYQR